MLTTCIETQNKSIIIIERHFFGKKHGQKSSSFCDLHLFYFDHFFFNVILSCLFFDSHLTKN